MQAVDAQSAAERIATTFTVRGTGPDGREVSLEVSAAGAQEATRIAAQRGVAVIAVESSADATDAPRRIATGNFPLLLFSQELLSLLDAGLNLTEAMVTLSAKERQPAVRAELQRIVESLRQGRNLSDVLAAAPRRFPEVYIATIRASERTGDLARALGRYIAYQQQFDEIRRKLVSASIYPAALLVVGAFVFLFLLGYVVPRFSVVYDASNREIPWLSLVMLQTGRWIHGHWTAVGLMAVVAAVVGAWTLRRPAVRRRLFEAVLQVPWLAVRADEFRIARFYRAVSLLLASGIALPRALGMVTGLLGLSQQARLASARAAVNAGQALSVALVAASLANPVAESLIKVGERSGQMAEMLERTARFHDEEFARWIDWASRLLEPVLMAVIGVVIGAVVMLMYMPIFELAGSIQ